MKKPRSHRRPRRTHTIIVEDTESFDDFMTELLYQGYTQWVTYTGDGCLRPSLPCPEEGGPCSNRRRAKEKQPIPLRFSMKWPEWKRACRPALKGFWARWTEQDWRHPTKRNEQARVHAMIKRVLDSLAQDSNPTTNNRVAELVTERLTSPGFDAVKKYVRQYRLHEKQCAGCTLTRADRAFLRRYPVLRAKYGGQP